MEKSVKQYFQETFDIKKINDDLIGISDKTIKKNKNSELSNNIIEVSEAINNIHNRIFYNKSRRIAYTEYFNCDFLLGKYTSYLYANVEGEAKLLGIRFYQNGYEKIGEEQKYFTLLLPAPLTVDQSKIDNINTILIETLDKCTILEKESDVKDYDGETFKIDGLDPLDVLNKMMKNHLSELPIDDIHGMNFKTLAFSKLLKETLVDGSSVTIDYNDLFKNVSNGNLDLEKYKINEATRADSKYVLIPTNIKGHATVILFNQKDGKKYLFDSSMQHYGKLEKEDTAFLNSDGLELICNFDKKCFQSSGCCTYYSMSFMKVFAGKPEKEIENILSAINKKDEEKSDIDKNILKNLQLEVILEMSDLFDNSENKTIIKIIESSKIDEKKYIKFKIGDIEYGLSKESYSSKFLELEGIENFVKEGIINQNDKIGFENMIEFQKKLLEIKPKDIDNISNDYNIFVKIKEKEDEKKIIDPLKLKVNSDFEVSYSTSINFMKNLGDIEKLFKIVELYNESRNDDFKENFNSNKTLISEEYQKFNELDLTEQEEIFQDYANNKEDREKIYDRYFLFFFNLTNGESDKILTNLNKEIKELKQKDTNGFTDARNATLDSIDIIQKIETTDSKSDIKQLKLESLSQIKINTITDYPTHISDEKKDFTNISCEKNTFKGGELIII